jgi:RNA polymerase sigma-70 factor, ECF subfamily
MASTQTQYPCSFHALYLQELERGDVATTNHFLSYFRPRLQSILRKNGVPTDSVEDLQQETLLRVLAVLQSKGIRDPERLGSFVYAVCRNTLLELYRKTRRYVAFDDSVDDLPCGELNPDAILVKTESATLVRRVLSRLSSRDQTVLSGLLIEEKSKAEICEELGVTRGHLRLLLHRAKRQFVSHIKTDEMGLFARERKNKNVLSKFTLQA